MGGIVNCVPRDAVVLPHLNKAPSCCNHCGAFINPYCRVEVQVGRWFCTFCGASNVVEDNLRNTELQVAPELTTEAVEYVSAPSDVYPSEGLPLYASIVILLDATLDEQNMVPVRKALKSMLQSLHPNTMISLLSFDGCVSMYNLDGKPGMVKAHTIPGHTIHLPKGSRRVLADNARKLFRAGSCLPMAEQALDCIGAHKESFSERERPRCLGVALHEGLLLLQEQRHNQEPDKIGGVDVPKRERILLLTGGPTTYGPGILQPEATDKHMQGSVEDDQQGLKLFMRLAAVSQGMGVAIDLFGIGPSSSGVSILEPLTRATGGRITYHSTINSTMLACSMQAALWGTFGTGGLLDVRLSAGLQLVAVIGNVFERLGSGESGVRKLSRNACSMRNMEVGKGLGLWIEATKDFEQQDLFMQVLLSWKTMDGHLVERVVTRKLSPTGNLAEYMKSINPSTASVLLAKKLVLDTAQATANLKPREAQDIRLALSSRLNYLAQKFGKVLENKSGFFGFGRKPKWSCPQELSVFAHALYHLQRGPMIGPMHYHAFDRAFLHSMFLSGSQASSESMLIPRMYELDPGSLTFQEVPPIDLALKSNTAMLLDHGSQMYIWLGDSIPDDSGSTDEPKGKHGTEMNKRMMTFAGACESYAEVLCKGRAPIPELHVVLEGQKNADWVLSRVIPGRRDHSTDQRNQLSHLMLLDPAMPEKLVEKFPATKEPSLYEWCRDACVEPPRQDVARVGLVSGLPRS